MKIMIWFFAQFSNFSHLYLLIKLLLLIIYGQLNSFKMYKYSHLLIVRFFNGKNQY